MKQKLVVLFGILIGFSAAAVAADFREVYISKRSGLKWSQYLAGYPNGDCGAYPDPKCPLERDGSGQPVIIDNLPQVEFSSSAAARACAEIGGRLPTAQELIGLFKEFAHTEQNGVVRLTERGKTQLEAAFENHAYWENWWSSSVVSIKDPDVAYHFMGNFYGITTSSRGLFSGYGVRCVK